MREHYGCMGMDAAVYRYVPPPGREGAGATANPPPHPPTQKTSRLCALAALDPDSPSPVATPNHLITWQPFGLPKYEIWLFEERGLRAQAQD